MIETTFLHEDIVDNHRLGRHVRHDPRSWQFPTPMAAHLVTVRHKRHVPIFNQGQVGSCTGEAAIGCISTGPFAHRGLQSEAVATYSDATRIDNIRGVYPPTDTGSSGLAVMKALRTKGLIKGYTHSFSLSQALQALVLRPGITGISWRTGCDDPDAHGIVRYEGSVRGGHEIVLAGLDVTKKLVWFDNSWGPSWGANGSFAMSWDDFGRALTDHGDVTFPMV